MTQARYIFALSKAEGARIGLLEEGLVRNNGGEEVFLFGESTRGAAGENQKKAREFIEIFGRHFGSDLARETPRENPPVSRQRTL